MSGRLVREPRHRIIRCEDGAERDHDLRYDADEEHRQRQAAEPGEGVVRAGKDPREVEWKHPVALILAEEFRSLSRTEQHDQRGRDAEVAVVPDGRRLRQGVSGTGLADQRGDPDHDDGRQQGHGRKAEWHHLGPSAPPDPVGRSERRPQEPDGHGHSAQSRAVVALVSEVVDVARGAHRNNSSRPRRCCWMRTRGSPRSATESRTTSQGPSS